MNIFTKKLAESEEEALPIDPIELYQSLAYQEGYAYLRDIQGEVLRTWHLKREQKDVVCKMNTGSGKTLTGLLMLYSKLIETNEPSLYVCPDSQLVDQTILLASNYGIPVCKFENQSTFPSDFLNCKKILVCNFAKLFNGKSIFNRDKIKIGAVILDDAHKCVDLAREQCTLKLPRVHTVSKKLFSLFETDLKFQAQGSFHRLADCDPLMYMRVPYWTWMENHERIIQILNAYVSSSIASEKDFPNTDSIILKWNFLADNLLSYDCYISGGHVEITPIHVPYFEVPSFDDASHRFILSATFEDDYDLIKDLGINYESVLNPIVPKGRKDIGKRLILAPKRFDPKISDKDLRDFVGSYAKNGNNTVVLVPSEYKSREWVNAGALYVNKDNIAGALAKLESSVGNFMVFSNRYDGIDLHGNLCRVLILDGLPLFGSIQEQYIEDRLESLRAGKKAQIIEQGLGRGVRSGADHCVVYLMGEDLLGFLGLEKNKKYFTPFTRAQLNLGLQLLDGVSPVNSLKTLKETAELCLINDRDWIKMHGNELSKVLPETLNERKAHRLKVTNIEREALSEFKQRNYAKSSDIITSQIIPDAAILSKEKGWYYQLAAQLMYLGNRSTSNDLQSKACKSNSYMFHPSGGHIFKKILRKGVQPSNVKKNLESFTLPQDILMFINDILRELQYTPAINSDHFEKKLESLGKFLGFKAQLPEKAIGDGPDVLWCMTDGHYLILEAKSRSTHAEISRDNIQQLLHSETWFKNIYGDDIEYTAVTLQSSQKKGRAVSIHSKIKVMDQECLDLLHKNLYAFGLALQTTHNKAHTEEEISKLLVSYKFTPILFRETYLAEIR
jgi:replicative superfamily II helicase